MVLTFRLADDVVSSLKNILLSRGFIEYIPGLHHPTSWNFQWKTTRYSDTESTTIERGQGGGGGSSLQLLNHYQKVSGICQKDSLARNLRRMRKIWGDVYNYSPETFILPRDVKECENVIREETERCKSSSLPPTLWICKPSSSSQGKNIYLIKSFQELIYDCSFVVQRYIADPMLIGGYKYDLRIYVLVTSFRPLCVYMYREGLVRFSSQPYSLDDTSNLYSHLTNASINKHNPDDVNKQKEVIGEGCKWTIEKWFQYLIRIGTNPEYVWEKIKDIVILTLLSIVSEVRQHSRCFELFGFDIMLDSSMKPYIIEVNASPAIAISGDVDTRVKVPMMNDMLQTIGFDRDVSVACTEDRSNYLSMNEEGYVKDAQERADQEARRSYYAAVEANYAAAAESENEYKTNNDDEKSSSPPTSSSKSSPPRSTEARLANLANRADRIQRIPRIVRQMNDTTSSKSHSSSSSSSSSASSSNPLLRTPTKLKKQKEPTIIPISSSPPAGTPPRVPTKKSTSTVVSSSSSSSSKRTLLPFGEKRATSAILPSTTTTTTATTTPKKIERRRSENVPTMGSVVRKRTLTSSPSASSTSASRSSNAASLLAVSSSLSTAPWLVGDFERIFPFDTATTASSESIAPIAGSNSASSSSSSSSSTTSSPTQTPLALLFSAFSRHTVSAIKSRARARDRVQRERDAAAAAAASKDSDPSQPPPIAKQFSFSSHSRQNVPSVWTEEEIELAVQRAKDAAKKERARLGLPVELGSSASVVSNKKSDAEETKEQAGDEFTPAEELDTEPPPVAEMSKVINMKHEVEEEKEEEEEMSVEDEIEV